MKREAVREGNPGKFAAMVGTDAATYVRERPGRRNETGGAWWSRHDEYGER